MVNTPILREQRDDAQDGWSPCVAGCYRRRLNRALRWLMWLLLASYLAGLAHHSAAGDPANTLAHRNLVAGFVSVVLAGTVITMFTWLAEAAESDLTKGFVVLAVGFVLLAPSTNGSVVGFGEVLFGIVAGTTGPTGSMWFAAPAERWWGTRPEGVLPVAFVRSIQAGARCTRGSFCQDLFTPNRSSHWLDSGGAVQSPPRSSGPRLKGTSCPLVEWPQPWARACLPAPLVPRP